MYGTIVVPVDLSHPELGRRALATARELGGPACRIVALHVAEEIPRFVTSELPKEVLRGHGAAALAALRALADEVAAEAEVRSGYAPRKVVQFAESIGADLIVVDSHRFEPEDYILGAPAVRVARHARCPVLICPAPESRKGPTA